MAQFPGPLRFPHTALSQHQIHQQQQTENDKYSVKNVPVLPPQQKQDQKDSHSTVQQTMTVRLRKDQTTMMFKHKLERYWQFYSLQNCGSLLSKCVSAFIAYNATVSRDPLKNNIFSLSSWSSSLHS
nr:hypothetical protein HmN_000962100 [Hymenolepis microstoma]